MSIIITSEWPYCAYPIVTEMYNFCFHECLYCFTKHKETWHNKAKKRKERGFIEKKDSLNIDRFKRIISNEPALNQEERILKAFIDKRYALQIGGQTDPGGVLETEFKKTLSVLKILKQEGKHYPIRISTKSDIFTQDECLEVLRDYKNASVLISMISANSDIVNRIEPGAPSINERFLMARELSKTEVNLGLRLRPIIPNFTEKTIEELIRKAKENGFSWVTVEWLRIPRTLTRASQANFQAISELINFDLIGYYKKTSDIKENKNGYLRLKADRTIRLYEKIHNLCKKYNLGLASCNKDFRCHNTDTPNCCGVPIEDNSWNRMQNSYAVHVAKKNRKVYFEDVFDPESPLNLIANNDNKTKKWRDLSYGQSFQKIWNDSEHRYYPARFFPELKFHEIDSSGNHIFIYNENLY